MRGLARHVLRLTGKSQRHGRTTSRQAAKGRTRQPGPLEGRIAETAGLEVGEVPVPRLWLAPEHAQHVGCGHPRRRGGPDVAERLAQSESLGEVLVGTLVAPGDVVEGPEPMPGIAVERGEVPPPRRGGQRFDDGPRVDVAAGVEAGGEAQPRGPEPQR